MSLWDRQQNKRALAKKERAKNRSFDSVGGTGHQEGVVGAVVWAGPSEYTVRQDGRDIQCPKDAGLEPPVVGDHVFLEGGSIIGIAERDSFLARFRRDSTRRSGAGAEHVIAANINTAVIVASVEDPPFHPRLVDRYLIACQDGDVEPVICLTKIDLADARPAALDTYRKLGVRVIEVSSVTKEGIQELRGAIANKVVVFVGASGVGKSSLVNATLHNEAAKTGEVGGKTGRGRHTTTSSQMYEWMAGSWVIDTPGIRSMGLDHLEPQEVEYYFPEFDPYRFQCKFHNCLHTHEPECAVKKAVEEGLVSRERYESYIRLLEES